MTVDEFIAATQKVIQENGFDAYLPTLIVETRKAMRLLVLQDDPPDSDIESFAKAWAFQLVKHKQDYFLAFKVDDSDFKIICRRNQSLDERVVLVEP